MRKKLIVSVLCLFILLIALVLILLNSAGITERLVPALLQRQWPDIKVYQLSIGRQSYHFPATLKFENIQARMNVGKDRYDIDDGSMDLTGENLFRSWLVQIKMRQAASAFLKVRTVTLRLQAPPGGEGPALANGAFSVLGMDYLNYQAQDISGDITFDENKLTIENLKAGLYGGRAEGKIVMEYQPALSYSITTKLIEVDVKRLEKANPAVFSHLKAKVSGDFRMARNVEGKTQISGTFFSVGKGEIKASLLKPLLDYLPQSTQKKQLKELLKTEGDVPLDTAIFTFDMPDDEKIVTTIGLKSKEFNLDVSLNLDFNVEGGIHNLMKLHERYFLQKR